MTYTAHFLKLVCTVSTSVSKFNVMLMTTVVLMFTLYTATVTGGSRYA